MGEFQIFIIKCSSSVLKSMDFCDIFPIAVKLFSKYVSDQRNHTCIHLIYSFLQYPKVLPSLGVRRPSVNFSYFNLLL